jgi:hypothetical protein
MALPIVEAQRVAPISAVAARLGLVAGCAFMLLLVVVHVAKPDLDPSWRPISEYALGDHGWLMTLAFLLWGSSAIGVFVALRSQVQTTGGRIGLAFLLLGAAGPILAAIFPMDPLTAPADAATTSGTLHSVGAVLGDGIAIGAALITWSLARKNPAWARARRPLLWATVLAWAGAVALSVSMIILLPQHGGRLGPDVPVGWQGRFMAAAYVAWLMTAAACAMRLGKAPPDVESAPPAPTYP